MVPLSVVLGPSSSPQAGTVQEVTMHIVWSHSRLLQMPVPCAPAAPVVPVVPAAPVPATGEPPVAPLAEPPRPPVSAAFGLTPAQAATRESESHRLRARGRLITEYVSAVQVHGSKEREIPRRHVGAFAMR